MCLRAWLLWRRHLQFRPRKLNPRVPGQHLPAPLKRKLPWGWPGNPLQRRGPWTSSLVGRRCYIPPNPWWLLDRSPLHQEVQDWGLATGEKGWFESLKLKDQRWQPPCRNPPHLHKSWMLSGEWCHLLVYCEWWHAWGGTSLWKGSTRYPQTCWQQELCQSLSGDHECKWYCDGWGDRGHLHGHCNHLSGEGGSQWPWTEDLSPGAHDTGHYRPHLRSNQINTFGWWGKPTTTVERVNQLMTAYGQINLPMTASGWKDYNAIGQ